MPESPRVFTVPCAELLADASAPGRPGDVLSLAQALAASPPWETMPRTVMVARDAPRPLLGILGYVDEAGAARIEALIGQLATSLRRLRYVDYAQAEADCERLAEALVARLGTDAIGRARFVAIPRGGYFVLGMLAYLLDLPPTSFVPHHLRPEGGAASPRAVPRAVPRNADGPLVVVDDCALTGVRFGQFAAGLPGDALVFAPLYSHPHLRVALEDAEERVVACVSGRDLHDHAPALHGANHEAWRRRWAERSGNACRWIGMPDHICFPWSEPDVAIWNPVTEREEPGWRIVPPGACLKNRPPLGSTAVRLQVQRPAPGVLAPADDVLFATVEDDVIVASTGTEKAYRLRGVAAASWHAIARHGALRSAQEDLSTQFDVAPERLEADLASFVDDLLTARLLVCRERSVPA